MEFILVGIWGALFVFLFILIGHLSPGTLGHKYIEVFSFPFFPLSELIKKVFPQLHFHVCQLVHREDVPVILSEEGAEGGGRVPHLYEVVQLPPLPALILHVPHHAW